MALKSTVVEFDIVFSNDSIVACAEAATDAERRMSDRRWHAEYLKQIMPDLDLTRWRRGAEDLPEDERAKMEAEIEQELDHFETFWKDKANAAAIQSAIAKINRDAGLSADEADDEPNDDKK